LQLDGPDVLTSDFLLELIESGCFSISLFICQEGGIPRVDRVKF